MLPDEIRTFIKIFSALPSIGIRQATRLAFKLVNSGKTAIDETAKAISDLRFLKLCSRCFFVYQGPEHLCSICSDPKRRGDIIALIEKETDLISIEKTGKFKGRYLILGELAKSGELETSQKLRLSHLKTILKKDFGPPYSQGDGRAEEIILALNPTTYGDLNALIISKELEGSAKKITRLGRGIPTGGEIEFADEDTLRSALERRG